MEAYPCEMEVMEVRKKIPPKSISNKGNKTASSFRWTWRSSSETLDSETISTHNIAIISSSVPRSCCISEKYIIKPIFYLLYGQQT